MDKTCKKAPQKQRIWLSNGAHILLKSISEGETIGNIAKGLGNDKLLAAAARELEGNGLASPFFVEEQDAPEAIVLTDRGEDYIAVNPKLANPIDKDSPWSKLIGIIPVLADFVKF
mgnify:CR=1 FL=1